MNEQEFAQRLRQYRKNKGMTQQELADQLGVSNKTVSRWESGSYPDVTTMVALARWLAREPGVDNSALIFSWKDLFRLRLSLSRASFRWTKTIPVLAPLVLMGYWCLFWRDDLPGWLYVSQKELYLPVWAGVSLLTMLPLLKKGRRGMLPPALALSLVDLTFPRLLVYKRGYRTIKETVIVMGNWTSPNVHSFGQANEELIVNAIVLALLYLVCCFIAIKRVPKEEKKEETEPEESGTF